MAGMNAWGIRAFGEYRGLASLRGQGYSHGCLGEWWKRGGVG